MGCSPLRGESLYYLKACLLVLGLLCSFDFIFDLFLFEFLFFWLVDGEALLGLSLTRVTCLDPWPRIWTIADLLNLCWPTLTFVDRPCGVPRMIGGGTLSRLEAIATTDLRDSPLKMGLKWGFCRLFGLEILLVNFYIHIYTTIRGKKFLNYFDSVSQRLFFLGLDWLKFDYMEQLMRSSLE